MEANDFTEGIALTTKYYNGYTEKVTLGLPEDDAERRRLVGDKLREMVSSSLRYTLTIGKAQALSEETIDAQVSYQKMLHQLTVASFEAAISLGDMDFLFYEIYNLYLESQETKAYFKLLETYIVQNIISEIPIELFKDLANEYINRQLGENLELIICALNPLSLDIDFISSICRTYSLHDAFTFVYNSALHDFVSPFKLLLEEVIAQSNTNIPYRDESEALKIYPYLSYIFSGRVYPAGGNLDDALAVVGQTQLYSVLFNEDIKPSLMELDSRNSFPVLRLLLNFQPNVFYDVLDEAFEHPFLNGDTNVEAALADTMDASLDLPLIHLSRQYIINILREIVASDPSLSSLNLNLFIARNLPKYPQFILLPSSTIEDIIMSLASGSRPEIADISELAVESLLSVSRPTDTSKLVDVCLHAHFYRVLKSTYRLNNNFESLLEIAVDDRSEVGELFSILRELLREDLGISSKRHDTLVQLFLSRINDIVEIDAFQTADLVIDLHLGLHETIWEHIRSDDPNRFQYLRRCFKKSQMLSDAMLEDLVTLTCHFDKDSLLSLLKDSKAAKLDVDRVMPKLEEVGAIESIVHLLLQHSRWTEAMSRVIFAIEDSDRQSNIHSLIKLGIFIAVTASVTEIPNKGEISAVDEAWANLLAAVVVHSVKFNNLRSEVQNIFTTLLGLTTKASSTNLNFINIFKLFLTKVSSRSASLSYFRFLIEGLFLNYGFEGQLLKIANSLLRADLYTEVAREFEYAKQGWRVQDIQCTICGQRLWGTGVGIAVYEHWQADRIAEALALQKRQYQGLLLLTDGDPILQGGSAFSPAQQPSYTFQAQRRKDKQKAAVEATTATNQSPAIPSSSLDNDYELIVFSCGHAVHQQCFHRQCDRLGKDPLDYKCGC